jgi:hypothetical protein
MKKSKGKLVLAKETLLHLGDAEVRRAVGARGCTGPATRFTANDCSGETYTGASNACGGGTDSGWCGASQYCTLIQQ